MYFTHHIPDEGKSEPLLQAEGTQEMGSTAEKNSPPSPSSVAVANPVTPTSTTSQKHNGQLLNAKLQKSKMTNVVAKVNHSIKKRPDGSGSGVGFTDKSYEDYTHSKKAIIRALAIILLYLIIGTAVFAAWMEDWDAIDAVYFTVATFTTVGYGDLFPVTKGQRIFGIFFVTLGIMIIGGVVLGVLMDALFGIFENAIDESEKQAQEKFIGKFNDDDQSPPQDHPDDAHKKSKLKLMKRMKTIVKNLILAALIFVPGLIIGHFEGWLFYESIYYSIVTATTVGYGDLSPQNMWTRLAACFYLPLCVTVMASVFGQITSFYMDRRTKEAEDEFFHRKLTLKDLEEMDFGGDGNVNSEEFLIFMLVTLGKVDSASIDQIQALFRKLDVDGGGCLDMADICIRAFGDDEARSRISDDRNV